MQDECERKWSGTREVAGRCRIRREDVTFTPRQCAPGLWTRQNFDCPLETTREGLNPRDLTVRSLRLATDNQTMNQLSRLLLLLAGSALLLGWVIKHSEPTSNVGLRYIEQARQIERGGWREGFVSGDRSSAASTGDRGDPSVVRWRQPWLVAARGPALLVRLGGLARHSDLPARPGALR